MCRSWAASARHPPPIRRALGAGHGQLLPSTPERGRVQSGDGRDPRLPTVASTGRLEGGIPPPLLFIQTGPPHVHVLREPWSWMGGFLLAMWTLASVDRGTRHHTRPWVRGSTTAPIPTPRP